MPKINIPMICMKLKVNLNLKLKVLTWHLLSGLCQKQEMKLSTI